jgi:hypothetical protein
VISYPTESYINHSSLELREKLLSKLEHYSKRYGLSPIPESLLDKYRYYEERYYVVQIIVQDLTRLYPGQVEPFEGDTYAPTLYKLIKHDLDAVPLAAAMAAWISWDNWRFDGELKSKNLSYGLVLNYPHPMMRAACFVAGTTKEDELDNCIPLEKKKTADLYAVQEILKNQGKERIEILQKLKKHRLAILNS